MRKIDLGQSISMLASVGVIAGIALVLAWVAVVFSSVDDDAPITDVVELDTPTEPQAAAAEDRAEISDTAVMVTASESAETADDEVAEIIRIPLPPEFALTYEKSGGLMFKFHEEVERQPRDPEWADFLEARFRDKIASSPNFANIDVVSAECRRSVCEILAMGYSETAVRAWMDDELSEGFEETWLLEMPDGGEEQRIGHVECGGEEVAPGVTALYCGVRFFTPEGLASYRRPLEERRTQQAQQTAEIMLDPYASDEMKASAWGDVRMFAAEAWTDAIVAEAVRIGTTSPDPQIRADIWLQAKANHTHPLLLQPLLEALSYDPSSGVRGMAAYTLALYLDQPGVREALQVASQQDADLAVRQQAEESLAGPRGGF